MPWQAFLSTDHPDPVTVRAELAWQWIRHYREAAAAGWSTSILEAVRQQNELAWRWRFEHGWWGHRPRGGRAKERPVRRLAASYDRILF